MQKAMYPSPYMRLTQGYQMGTHLDSFAIDDAGSDGGIDFLVAPFDCIVKKIYTTDANEVWIESLYPVKFADGTEDYMTIMLAHDNDVSDLWVGKVIKQGDKFYDEGTKGNATGNHVHFECSRGKFTGSGWHQNSAGYWSIDNAKKPEECLFIDDSYHILNDWGLNWKKVPSQNLEQNSECDDLKKENELLKNENILLKEENARLKTENSNHEVVHICKKSGKHNVKITLYKGEKLVIEK